MLNAKLTVYTGSMFASKSSALISQGERHLLAGRKVIYVKPESDTRYSESKIVTHAGQEVEAVTLKESEYLIRVKDYVAINGADVILFDEIQLYNGRIIEIIKDLLSKDKVIYVAGLDMDYKGRYFDITAILMGIADEVNKLKAVCSICGEDSYISAKTGGSAERIELGSQDLYTPMCRGCYKLYEGGKFDGE